MAQDIGKIFEKELEKVFRSLKESHLLGWHRLADTSAAGGSIINAQPSDYLLALPPGSRSPVDGQRLLFVEAKASEKHRSLTKGAMQPSQRGAVSLYRVMLQLPYLVLFWDAANGSLQVWDGAAAVDEARISDRYQLAEFNGVGAGIRLNTERVAEVLAGWFDLPGKAKTLEIFNAS